MKTEKPNDSMWSLTVSQRKNVRGRTVKQEIWKRGRLCLWAAGALLVACGSLTSCKDEYDLDETTPQGWTTSIYSWLTDKGNYTNTVRLIDDLKYRETLAKTGSKTIFVADDAAYERFFANNPWGVKNYGQLSLPQKKMLLIGNMIDNSIQLNNLSNVEGTPPREGECMRRFTSLAARDSVMLVKPEDMPDNPYWKRFKDANRSIYCMTDGSEIPMIMFIEKQMQNKRITDDDYYFLFNKKATRKPGDASINGVTVAESNIKCLNGFVHRMEEVAAPLPNLAEMIARKAVTLGPDGKPLTSLFNRLLNRFSAPYPDQSTNLAYTKGYNDLYQANVDTLYMKRFVSDKSGRDYSTSDSRQTVFGTKTGTALTLWPNKKPANDRLKFDPSWNTYFAGNKEDDGYVAEQRDMAVIMVPSDAALDEYWNKGAGSVLRDNYGTWDNVPDDVILKLINNNMLSSFVSSVPSKFSGIPNDANDPMGVTVDAVDSVWLCCNGAVYLTNRVYSPTAYISVSFPALINRTMKIIDWAIEQNQYEVYMNALKTYYSFFIPLNDAMLEYVDPCSYGKTSLQILRFFYDDDDNLEESKKVWAGVWNYDPLTGARDSVGELRDYNMIKNRLKDVLDTHIVIGNVEDGNTYYRTKGGTEIRVQNASLGKSGMTVEGSYQLNEGTPQPVFDIYDMTKGGNGKSYVLAGEPIMTTRQTVCDILKDHPEFSEFYNLMIGSPLHKTEIEKRPCGGDNLSVFNTYHYTIYVPTNASIVALQTAGKLPTWDIVDADRTAGNLTQASADSTAIVDFLKYHIQDNALFLGAKSESGTYETSCINNIKGSTGYGRFYRLDAELTPGGITVLDQTEQDARDAGLPYTSHKVLTSDPTLYNLMAREYIFDKDGNGEPVTIYTTSSAVVHLIDRPLMVK